MKTMRTLEDLFVLKLKALYDIETVLIKALPKMAKKASDAQLKKGFEAHLRETESHVKRLEKAFKALDLKPSKTKVEAIRGLVADAEWAIKEKPEPQALDALLVASAMYVEHYEMAGYMAASNWADMLGYAEIAELLKETLEEEEKTAEKLELLAEGGIDKRAMDAMV